MRKIWIAFLAAVATSAATAKTTAWYHFDEGDIGTKPARGETVILNAIDNSLYPGKAYQHANANFQISEDSTYMPIYTNAFPSPATWWDPVTGERGTDGKSLFFKSKTADAYREGPIVMVEDGGALTPKTVTIECFFRSAEFASDVCWQTLVLRDASDVTASTAFEPFFIRVSAQKGFSCVFHTTVAGRDGVVMPNNVGGGGSYYYRDGNWHHMALVIDDDAKKAELFVDYASVSSKTFEGTLVADGDIYIGNTYSKSYGVWHGCIDEVRFSDTALKPSEFLRYDEYSRPLDKDVVLHSSFVRPDWFGPTNAAYTVENLCSGDVKLYLRTNSGTNTVVDVVPSGTYRHGVLSEEERANHGSFHFQVNEKKDGAFYGPYLCIDDIVDGRHSVLTNSFTLEGFFKLDPGAINYGYLVCMHREGGAGSWFCTFNSSGSLEFQLWDKQKGKRVPVGSFGGVKKDEWHHIAMTYDRATSNACFYVDYKLMGSRKLDFDASYSSNYSPYLCVGNGYGDTYYGIEGYYDEIRLTARALLPQEFLTCSRYVDVPHAAWMDFEGNLTVEPYTVETAAGQATGAQITSAVGARALANENGGSGRINAGALELNGGKVVYGRNLMIENLENQTIEFFVKGTAVGGDYANIVRLTRSEDAANPLTSPIWAITAMTETSDGGLTIRTDTEALANQGLRAKNINLCDGRWHHVALTYQKVDESATTATLWVDYAQVGMANVSGTLKWEAYNTTVLTIGGSTFNGCVDEFRVTPTVLPSEKFLRFFHAGTVLIFR